MLVSHEQDFHIIVLSNTFVRFKVKVNEGKRAFNDDHHHNNKNLNKETFAYPFFFSFARCFCSLKGKTKNKHEKFY